MTAGHFFALGLFAGLALAVLVTVDPAAMIAVEAAR